MVLHPVGYRLVHGWLPCGRRRCPRATAPASIALCWRPLLRASHTQPTARLWAAAPTGSHPLWADRGRLLAPVTTWQPLAGGLGNSRPPL
ncbi:hypothetical protein BHM03_00029473 [Ensete ventricosum]|nr:hypothetical protein BHM03_00029473 [Ensete ventricosum]